MTVSELIDVDELVRRLAQLEDREAEIERGLAKLLERQRRLPSDAAVEQIASLQRDHLKTRRELNTTRAQLVPIERTSAA